MGVALSQRAENHVHVSGVARTDSERKREAALKQGGWGQTEEREEDGWSREEGYDDGILTASGSPIETPFDHPKVLRSGPEHSPLESARCLISGHANEIRCASKDELADTKPLKKIKKKNNTSALPVFPAWSFSRYHDLHGEFIHAKFRLSHQPQTHSSGHSILFFMDERQGEEGKKKEMKQITIVDGGKIRLATKLWVSHDAVSLREKLVHKNPSMWYLLKSTTGCFLTEGEKHHFGGTGENNKRDKRVR